LSEPLIRADRLTKYFQSGDRIVTAVSDVSLAIHRGEFLAIMGPSGSGKSTFMNLLGCLDSPSGGDLMIEGQSVSGMTGDDLAGLRNRKFGFVFQQFNLLARTSAVDNVALPLVYSGIPTLERRRRATVRLTALGLAERLDHTPSQLSGGQQQRVAIARALIVEPVVLLADEPTGALDSATTADIMKLLSTLNAAGLTIVLVTHEEEVAAYAGRRIIFGDGKVVDDRKAA
jgi:putative ABC transport system ATP-binding protein